MEKLVEIMLNEGLDENTIINVISNLMNEEVKEETHSLSESCFNDIISLVEELICEMNPLTVAKVQAIRTKNKKDAENNYNNSFFKTNKVKQDLTQATDKYNRNKRLTDKYVKRMTGNPNKQSLDVQDYARKIGNKLIKSNNDLTPLNRDEFNNTLKFDRAEQRYFQKTGKKPTGIMYTDGNNTLQHKLDNLHN